jgi:hypothetical protein
MLSITLYASTLRDYSQAVGVLRSHLWNVALLEDYNCIETRRMLCELCAHGVSKVSSQLAVLSGVSRVVCDKHGVRVW